MIDIRKASGLLAILQLSVTSAFASADDLCAGFAGRWRMLDNISLADNGNWKTDTGTKDWKVDLLGRGHCRIIFDGADPLDVDTTNGTYDVINFVDGKPTAPFRAKFVYQEYQGPKRWRFIVEWPPKEGQTERKQLEMVMTGDLLLYHLQTSKEIGAPFLPSVMAFHRRQP